MNSATSGTTTTLQDANSAWDRNAESRLAELALNNDPAYRALINKALEYLGRSVEPGGRVLDVGSGLGFLTASLYASGYDVIGIDPSERSVQLARQHHTTLPAKTFAALPLHEYAKQGHGLFDAVVANMTLHSVERLQTFFDDVSRVLAPGGVFYVAIPNPKTYLQSRSDVDTKERDLSVKQVFHILFRIHGHQPHPSPVPFYHYPLRDYISMAASAGLRVLDFDVPAHIGPGRSSDITLLLFGRDVDD